MVKIRLTRGGAKKHPHYRIIAIDERKPRDGRPLEYLGTYDPNLDPERLDVRLDRVEAWIANGARPSSTVKNLIKRLAARAAAAAG